MNLTKLLTVRRCEVAVLALGVLVRACDYFALRSLWLDEAMLARNIVDRDAADLLRPLDHNQGAPAGFLVAQKLLVAAFGSGEEVFRLLPTVLGIWSLLLFARLSKQLFGPAAALRVLPVFAFNPFLVTATNKQYPVDLWAGLFLLMLVLRVAEAGARRRDFAFLAVAGAGLVWVSHAAPLLEAAFGSAVILAHARAGRWRRAAATVAVAGFWVVSFAACYWVSIRHLRENAFLVCYWQGGFPPPGGSVAAHLEWAWQVVSGAFAIPVRLSPRQLALALAALGAVRLARDPLRFGLVVLPVAIALGAAAGRVLPFQGRLILFLIPAWLWLVAVGLDGLASSQFRLVRAVACVALVAFLWRPALDAKAALGPPKRWEEARETMRYVAANAHPEDVVYVHPDARHTFEFYRERVGLRGVTVVHGDHVPPADAARQIRELPAGHRLWAVHSEFQSGLCPGGVLTRNEVLDAAGTGRTPLGRLDAPGVCAALFSVAHSSP